MPAKIYRVKLEEEEQRELRSLTSKGKAAVRKQNHARILLLSDENSSKGSKKDDEITAALGISRRTIERVRKRFVEEGLENALNPRPKTGTRNRKLDGDGEAFLIATACSEPPEGHASWTLRLLADRLVECDIADTISYETVRQTLKKTRLSLG